MSLASSSLVTLAYVKESTWGVIPTTGNHSSLRMTGESLTYDITKVTSEEIDSSRSVSSQIPVSSAASGGVNTEISYNEYDPLIEAALQSTFTVYGTAGVGTTFTGAFTATTITASAAPTGSSAFTNLQAGQFFRLDVAGAALNKGKIFRVSKSVAPTTTVITLDASTPALVETAIAGCAVQTSRLTNGTTQTSWTLERQSPDVTEYWAYSGMTVSSMELNMTASSKSSMAFNFMGKKGQRQTTTNLPGTKAASKAYDIHSGATGPVCYLWVDGAPLAGTFVQSVKMTYDNALRQQNALCSVGSVGIGAGTIAAGGTMDVYFVNGSLFDKFTTNTTIELTFSTLDNDGNGYIITIPKVNLAKVTTTAGGKDQDMMLSIDWTALRDNANATPALRQVIFIDRVGAAVT